MRTELACRIARDSGFSVHPHQHGFSAIRSHGSPYLLFVLDGSRLDWELRPHDIASVVVARGHGLASLIATMRGLSFLTPEISGHWTRLLEAPGRLTELRCPAAEKIAADLVPAAAD